MSSSPINRNAKNRRREALPSNPQVPASPKSCSPQEKCQFCDFIEASHWESGSAASHGSSAPQSASPCTLCDIEPPNSQTCQAVSKRRKITQSPVCVDPNCLQNICQDCPESICEECSDHGESCEECLEQCGSECGISLVDDVANCRFRDESSFNDSISALFGDQATHTFDLYDRLPQLPTDIEALDFEGSAPDIGNYDPVEMVKYGEPEYSFGAYDRLQFSGATTQFHMPYQPPKATESVSFDSLKGPVPMPGCGAEWSLPFAITADSVVEGTTSAPVCYSQRSNNKKSNALILPASPRLQTGRLHDRVGAAPDKAVGSARTDSSLVHVRDNVVWTRTSHTEPARPSARCQWADANLQPCGQVFEFGSELHEHLKTAHGVKNQVFCRWIGCRFGVLGATPHKYANSVERHTWGHSGHRPYKCPTCSEGFAAANVRDEHVANIHQKRKMFSCDMCAHQCTSARNLKRHKDDTHKTERFQCEFCNRHGTIRLFPRGSNLARHFRKCKYVLALFPNAIGSATGKIDDDWFPPGYRAGHQGMDRAKIMPPNYLPVSMPKCKGWVGSAPGLA